MLNYFGLVFGLLLIGYIIMLLFRTEYNLVGGWLLLIYHLAFLAIGVVAVYKAIKNIQKDKAQNNK